MPSIGELIRIPFHVTCVCEGDVPRNATVERVARPYCLTKIDVLKVRMSAIESAMFSCNIVVSVGFLDADLLHRPPCRDIDFADGNGIRRIAVPPLAF